MSRASYSYGCMTTDSDKFSKSHGALIFQGGGSLGAYEAGAYKAIYEKITEDYPCSSCDQPLFHIVAGTSIGAINASILVSHVKEKGTWEGSVDKLIDFWSYISTEPFVEKIPNFDIYWDYWHSVDNRVATSESARRYFSTKEFMITGVPAIFKPRKFIVDNRFFDPANSWYLFSNEPLKKSLGKFATFPIATSPEKNEPRLLLISVDVQEAVPVVFDSYASEDDGTRRTVYGRGLAGQQYESKDRAAVGGDDNKKRRGHMISYDDGITSDFVMASCSVPINYDYTRLEVLDYLESYNGDRVEEKEDKKTRYFWDGGLLANTPLRQALIAHNDYWVRRRKNDDTPPLQVCIVNLHPSMQDYVPFDLDGIIDRKNDIIHHDRTEFDERIAVLLSDYVMLVRSFHKLAQEQGVNRDMINELLHRKTHFKDFVSGSQLTYEDLMKVKSAVELVFRIERKNDVHTISNKTFDFSSKTINQLLIDGYEDARDQISRKNQFSALDWNDFI